MCDGIIIEPGKKNEEIKIQERHNFYKVKPPPKEKGKKEEERNGESENHGLGDFG